MFPGTTSKLSEQSIPSAATIDAKSDQLVLAGTTSIATIRANFGGGFSGVLFIIPKDGNVATVTTGNIIAAVTMPQNQVTVLTFSKTLAKWVPGAIS